MPPPVALIKRLVIRHAPMRTFDEWRNTNVLQLSQLKVKSAFPSTSESHRICRGVGSRRNGHIPQRSGSRGAGTVSILPQKPRLSCSNARPPMLCRPALPADRGFAEDRRKLDARIDGSPERPRSCPAPHQRPISGRFNPSKGSQLSWPLKPESVALLLFRTFMRPWMGSKFLRQVIRDCFSSKTIVLNESARK